MSSKSRRRIWHDWRSTSDRGLSIGAAWVRDVEIAEVRRLQVRHRPVLWTGEALEMKYLERDKHVRSFSMMRR